MLTQWQKENIDTNIIKLINPDPIQTISNQGTNGRNVKGEKQTTEQNGYPQIPQR